MHPCRHRESPGMFVHHPTSPTRYKQRCKIGTTVSKSQTYLVGDGLEQHVDPIVGSATCSGFCRSSITILPGAVPDEKDQFSATSVRSSQLCDICIALCISRSWFTSRLLLTSAHSSCRSCDIRGVRRGPGVPAPPPLPLRPGLALPFEMTASGLKLAENRRTRGVKMFENDVGSDSL
uniref:Uncharacterized protein n=1 Tax=Anopheles coluzzii TaxID=1518534 RepID=A0A8W7P321_ANOCL